jgi:hypothetical protein
MCKSLTAVGKHTTTQIVNGRSAAPSESAIVERFAAMKSPAAYRLREKARESWDHIIGDELVHGLQIVEVARNLPIEISKDHLKCDLWIAGHLAFEAERYIQYQVIVESVAARNPEWAALGRQ